MRPFDPESAIELNAKYAPYAIALRETGAWKKIVEFMELDAAKFQLSLQYLNPYADNFNQEFIDYQREIWARLRVVDIVNELADAHNREAQETEPHG